MQENLTYHTCFVSSKELKHLESIRYPLEVDELSVRGIQNAISVST